MQLQMAQTAGLTFGVSRKYWDAAWDDEFLTIISNTFLSFTGSMPFEKNNNNK